MVLGLQGKARKNSSVKLRYLIHIQEIKPWPPSQSLKSVRSVLIQWENGEKHSGSTSSVIPSLGSGINDGKIEFNESFRLPVTLLKDTSVKSGDGDAFEKNCLEFHLYEPRRDRTLKGQLLGTASVDFADYGVIKDAISITAQMNCQRNFRNTAQPVLYVKIQPVDKGSLSFSSKESLEMQSSLDKNGSDSVAALMREEYAAEEEMTSFSDDDVSSHASMTVPSSPSRSPPQNEQSGSVAINETTVRIEENHLLASDPVLELRRSDVTSEVALAENLRPAEDLLPSSSRSSSFDLSSDPGSSDNGNPSSNSFGRFSSMAFPKAGGHSAHSSISSIAIDQAEEESIKALSYGSESLTQDAHGESESGGETLLNSKDILITSAKLTPLDENLDIVDDTDAQVIDGDDMKCSKVGQDDVGKNSATDGIGGSGRSECYLEEEKGTVGDDSVDGLSVDAASEQSFLANDEFSSGGESHGLKGHVIDRLRHAKSVRSPPEITKSIGTASANLIAGYSKEGGIKPTGVRSFRSNERRDSKVYTKDTRSALLEAKVQQLEQRIKMLEGELIESAAVEVALFSVVAEHGSAMAKVHAPARRLSRLYIHACRQLSRSRRASAARSAVSGLVLVAKACGNDVPRLMYWLSNSVVLRTIISEMIEKTNLSVSSSTQSSKDYAGKQSAEIPSSLKWKSSSRRNGHANGGTECNWEDHSTFVSALERVEAWIFSRAVESMWWQTLTPYLQSPTIMTVIMGSSLSESGKRVTHEDVQGDISLEHWKKAFRDACERLCPVRAVGHECGCLPMLARLIMEQCVGRLDVAMFNAILRDSANGILSDPISDPISDPKVLPIPAGKSSFGIGAQLKNTIGNWSRWLTDLFGGDDTDLAEDESEYVDDERKDGSFKSFNLLSALSDLMMLPKDMLLSRSIRKEVCPTFAASLIKRVLDNFVPDEFCPDPIPDVVLEALESEDHSLEVEESVADYPYVAAPVIYTPPLASTVGGIIGEVVADSQLRRCGSSVIRKSYASDDELDELNSPLASIFIDGPRSSPVLTKPSWTSKQNANQNTTRYDLLREVWTNCE
ncbi:uncharacterized protein LOC115751073 [Rhodamnia argentea]|uniref:Uncharacterized protein LOC115751073 n=1 Tax=Rhodamnia argentea TaxID=178133 RepID=A0ABM3GVD2_9MYRT|nr:uncharacterized protein LOC115751073 [Rhodamnia argentea]